MEFLWEMLYEAANWRPEGPKKSRAEVFSSPEISHYLEGWGRFGDASVVALDTRDGAKIGAAWYRLMPPDDRGYGFVASATPEVFIAVAPDRRGTGVGEALLRAIMQTAYSEGFEALSLGVEKGNPAITLYKRVGFRELGFSEGSRTMKATLSVGDDVAAFTSALAMTVLEEHLSICQLDVKAEIPPWATGSSYFSVTRTEDELSIVCPEQDVPEDVSQERGWRALKLEGPFELSMVGVLASIAAPLAEAGVSIFAVSTFDTDYLLVRGKQLDFAVDTLREHGHRVSDFSTGRR